MQASLIPRLPRCSAPPGVHPARRGDGAAVVVGGAGFQDRSPGECLNDRSGGSIRLCVLVCVWLLAFAVIAAVAAV